MKHDKTTIVGVAACITLLLLWSPLMHRLGWVRPAPPPDGPGAAAPAVASTPDGGALDPAAGTPDGIGPAFAPELPAARPEPELAAAADAVPSSPAATVPEFRKPAETVSLAHPEFFTASIDPQGGGIVSVRLHRYRTDDQRDEVHLGSYQYPLCALLLDGGELPTGPATVLAHDDGELVIERPIIERDAVVRESWRLRPDEPYRFDYFVVIRNVGGEPLDLRQVAVTCGKLPTNISAERAGDRNAGGEGAVDVFLVGENRPKSYSAKQLMRLKTDEVELLANRSVQWIAVHSKYFVFQVQGVGTPLAGSTLGALPAAEKDAQPWLFASAHVAPTVLEPGAEAAWTFECYMGPKEYRRLAAIGGQLDTIMRMDVFLMWSPAWMGFITRLILRSLTGLNDFFGAHRWGYGYGIMIVTFVVKMLFWPLTHKSTASMRKMQKIQPLVKELRERHKGEPEKMNRKVMELYREHKVSPLGGCLPMFMQIPVFFALFNTFRNAIELRHASFLWVADLSLPDTVAVPFGLPIRPLAILMSATMLGQQKLMPASPDPNQARMMSFMSVFFLFIFYGMPAGLTLYWTVNQVLTIVQTLVSKRMEKAETA